MWNYTCILLVYQVFGLVLHEFGVGNEFGGFHFMPFLDCLVFTQTARAATGIAQAEHEQIRQIWFSTLKQLTLPHERSMTARAVRQAARVAK